MVVGSGGIVDGAEEDFAWEPVTGRRTEGAVGHVAFLRGAVIAPNVIVVFVVHQLAFEGRSASRKHCECYGSRANVVAIVIISVSADGEPSRTYSLRTSNADKGDEHHEA